MTAWDDSINDSIDAMTDDELLAELRAAVAEADLVTDRQREAARAAFTWRTVDAELAELLHDSALEAPRCAAAGDAARTLSFASGELTLEVEIDGDTRDRTGRRRRRRSRGPAALGADDQHARGRPAGFFRVEGVGVRPGAVRRRRRATGRSPVPGSRSSAA